MRWRILSAAASVLLTALVAWSLGWMVWLSLPWPASEPLPVTVPTAILPPTVTPVQVSAAGTRFPTNVPHSPPMATAPATATAVSVNDTLPTATFTPVPVAATTVEPVAAESDRFILVDQDAQRMRIFENGHEVRIIPVSTGRPVTNAFTPPWQGTVGDDWGSGAFRNSGLYSDFMWFLFPGPEGSILIHSVPYQKQGAEKQYDRLDALGVEPVSNGCVRISPEDAAWLKQWNPVGVPIEITRWSGKISSP